MDGYAVQVELVRVIDGDTVVVRAVGSGGFVWAYHTTLFCCPFGDPVQLRFIDVGAEANVRFAEHNTAELQEPGGQEAKDELIKYFAQNEKERWLFVESPKDTNKNEIVDLPEVFRQRVSFGRIVGRIMIGNRNNGCRNIVALMEEIGGN